MDSSEAEQQGIGAGSILRRKADGGYEWLTDEVAIEEPLEIRIGQDPLAVTMRTPGNDEELAAGFLLSEGIVRVRAGPAGNRPSACCPLRSATFSTSRLPARQNSLRRPPTASARSRRVADCAERRVLNSSANNFHRLIPRSGSKSRPQRFSNLPQRLRRAQGNFARTGGIHAAAIFDLRRQSDCPARRHWPPQCG